MAAYTYADFKRELRQTVFPEGEAVNLVAAHDKAILSGMIDVQKWVDCFQQNNTTVVAHCSTVFDCGLTVLDAPRGRIKQVSVIDSFKPGTTTPAFDSNVLIVSALSGTAAAYNGTYTWNETLKRWRGPLASYIRRDDSIGKWRLEQDGVENPTTPDYFAVGDHPWDITWELGLQKAPPPVVTRAAAGPDSSLDDNYCSEIIYGQIDSAHVQKFQSKTGGCNACGGNLASLFGVMTSFFGLLACGKKYFYPEPTDEGVPTNLEALPLGMKYAQKSTDAPRRSDAGRWAIDRGNIFVMPWIQSTESIIVKWDGIKRQFSDFEPVTDDPSFFRAVCLYVQADHARRYDRNPSDAAAFELLYNGQISTMMHECREETRVRGLETSNARGDITSQVTKLFYNDEQKYSAVCPLGTTGRSITITIDAGSVASANSVADANSLAKEQAKASAEAQLSCQPVPVVYYNTIITVTAHCVVPDGAPPADGNPVTITIQPGMVSSALSVDDANHQATTLATDLANAALECIWWNRVVSYTAQCPNHDGADVTVNVEAHRISSNISQIDADTRARDEIGQVEALQQITCASGGEDPGTPGGSAYINTDQTSPPYSYPVFCANHSITITGNGFVPAGSYAGFSQQDANQKAQNRAHQIAVDDFNRKKASWLAQNCFDNGKGQL